MSNNLKPLATIDKLNIDDEGLNFHVYRAFNNMLKVDEYITLSFELFSESGEEDDIEGKVIALVIPLDQQTAIVREQSPSFSGKWQLVSISNLQSHLQALRENWHKYKMVEK